MPLRAALLPILLLPMLAQALSLSPTRLELDLRSATSAEAELRLGGRPDRVQHLELSVVERLAEGTPVDPPGSGFSVELLPPQLSLAPGQHGTVRVQVRRLGTPAPASRSYYLVVEPVALDEPDQTDAPQLNFVPRVYLPLHVDLGGEPALRLRRVAGPGAGADDEEAGGAIELSNRGHRYQRLAMLRAVAPGGAVAGRELARRARTDAVLPGQTLRIGLQAGELAGEPLDLLVVPEP